MSVPRSTPRTGRSSRPRAQRRARSRPPAPSPRAPPPDATGPWRPRRVGAGSGARPRSRYPPAPRPPGSRRRPAPAAPRRAPGSRCRAAGAAPRVAPGLALARSRPHLIATSSQERVAHARPPAYGLWRDSRRVPHDLPAAFRLVSQARRNGPVGAPGAARVLRVARVHRPAAEPGPRGTLLAADRARVLRREPRADDRHDPHHLRLLSRPRAAAARRPVARLVEDLAAHRGGVRQGHRDYADRARLRRRRG